MLASAPLDSQIWRLQRGLGGAGGLAEDLADFFLLVAFKAKGACSVEVVPHQAVVRPGPRWAR